MSKWRAAALHLLLLDEANRGPDLVIFKKRVAGLNAGSLSRFVLRARKAVHIAGTVDVLITSSGAMRALNLRFREKNSATDVLSFPANPSLNGNRRSSVAGEIAISADIALDNASLFGHKPATEVKILVLHGLLHLAGYDHERDNGEMARKEAALRKTLRLPSSLTERGQSKRVASGGQRPGAPRSRRNQRTA